MLLNKQLIEKIIIESINAPSGSNSQPWEFICRENPPTIKIKYLPEKDHPILNFRNRGTLIACGALIENINVVCSNYGLKAKISLASESSEKIIAKIELEEAGEKNEELYSCLKLRSTNRKPYKKLKIEEKIKNYLFTEVKNYPQIVVSGIEDENLIREAAQNLAYDTYFNFKNPHLHEQLKNELLFDDNLAKQGYEGLYVKTMEFKGPQIFLVKKLLNRKFLNFMDKLGMIKGIYKNVVKLYFSTPYLLGFSVVNEDREFINLGRLIENIWLRAVKSNLYCHLITGIPFLWQKINFENTDIFTNSEKEIINNSYNNLKKIFNVSEDKIFVGVLRIGYASPPSAISVKKIPKINFE